LILAALAITGAPFAPVAPGSFAQSQTSSSVTGISVETSPQIFATMCALDAAGFDAQSSTFAEMPERLALRDQLLKLHGPATEAVRAFYKDYALSDPGETLSRFITFALVAGPPPNFRFQLSRDLLPPDVLAIEGFQDILAAFYSEAHLEIQWAKVEREYNRAAARDDAPLRKIVTNTNAYLRELIKPSSGRTFTLYVEPLVANRANFRNFGNRYAVVIGTGPQFPTDEVQHAYLHFMLDPLPLQYRKDVSAKADLLDVAAKAPRLPVVYQKDFLAFADECLIKAVELRLRRLPPEQLEVALRENDASGFILVRPFVAQLVKFEKAEPAMTYYFPDLIAGIDVDAEEKRLKDIKFPPPEQTIEPQDNHAAAEQTSELDSWLEEGDHDIAAHDSSGAKAAFEKVLAKYPNEPRATYGLALSWVLSGTQGSADNAKELFERLVSPPNSHDADPAPSAPTNDPKILAWSHVFLGRIHDLEDERDLALSEYHLALSVDGAPEAARVAAERGIAEPYQPRAHSGGNTPQNVP
jgi:tetratricopeptide (TPR) repeat protein